eukprot:CAMPEP_0172674658 /NCGR_PEP_ID=MMETSP1074-20121228/12853_1 /TAXON_ID=2916 /ORGANISM="Ceratium fusus, Strain PA161109" /LENGTH=528 /DNA_ID=CAMNT_0013492081 /DNA_START=337 /DNA_END=1923 /DNA_ORIENTATION=+
MCPLLIEFEASGDFTVGGRLRTSLRRNIAFYVAYIVLGLVIFLWLLMRGSAVKELESWCIAASSLWGLLLLTVLMGYGLVAVPRHLFQLADPSEQLRRIYAQAVGKDEARLSKLFELQDAMEQVHAEFVASQGENNEVAEEIPAVRQAMAILRRTLVKCEQLHGELTRPTRDGRTTEHGGAAAAPALPPPLPAQDEESGCEPVPSSPSQRGRLEAEEATRLERFAGLHCNLKAAGREARRAACCWDNLVKRCIFFEDLQDKQFRAAAELFSLRPRCGLSRGCCPHTQHLVRVGMRRLLALWLRSLRARVLLVLSYLSAMLSAVIVLGQLTMFAQGKWSLSLLSLLFHGNHGPWLTQILCFVPLSYMTYTAYFSIFRLKISGFFGLYGNHNTDTGSLLWCASVLARLVAPLCYHFLILIQVQGTTFQDFMGKMNVVRVLGESLNQVFPCLIAVLCCCNLLNPYSRILQFLSLGLMDFEIAAEGDDPLAEGKKLIDRERRRRAEDSALEMQSRDCPAPEVLEVPLAVPAG